MVLKDRQVIRGEVATPGELMVLMRTGDDVTALPAHKLASVQYYDRAANVNRKFVPVVSVERGYPLTTLYEVVVTGEVEVLRRPQWRAPTSYKFPPDGYIYFVRYRDETVSICRFRGKVYPALLQSHKPELTRFIKRQKLNPNVTADVIPIIQFHNQLPAVSLARH
ncbi:MAG: hypothetical protein HC859_13465 [Bacteroidia bacterium]|nr:hypothetical protein [Bacteroidia bacterium]